MAKISENNECDFEIIENLTDNVNCMENARRPSSINGGEKTPSNHTSTRYGGNAIIQSKSWLDQMGDTQEAKELITRNEDEKFRRVYMMPKPREP